MSEIEPGMVLRTPNSIWDITGSTTDSDDNQRYVLASRSHDININLTENQLHCHAENTNNTLVTDLSDFDDEN